MSGLYASTALVIQDTDLSLGDIVHFDRQYEWIGRVVQTSHCYTMLMDRNGRLCRFVHGKGPIVVLSRQDPFESFVASVTAACVAIETAVLLRYQAIIDAIICAAKAPSDPADFDRWMIPLSSFACHDAPLRQEAVRYMGWPAQERRKLECVLEFMQGERQREVLLENVLGYTSVTELRERYGLCKSAIRTARWRALRMVERYADPIR